MWPRARSRLRRALLNSQPASSASIDFWRSSMRACCSAVGESCGGAPGPLPAPLPSSICATTVFKFSSAICCFRLAISACASSSRRLAVNCAICTSFCCCACSASTRARRASAFDSLRFGKQAETDDRHLDGKPGADVIGGKFAIEIILADAIQQRSVAIVLCAEAYFRQPPQVQFIAFGNVLPRDGHHLGGFNTGCRPGNLIAGYSGDLGNARVIGSDRTYRQSRKCRQLFCEGRGSRFQMQTSKFKLLCRQSCLQQCSPRIHACVGALLLDIDKPRRVLLLLARGVEFPVDRVKFDVVRRSVKRGLLPRVFQRQLSRLQPEARGMNVLNLRHAEDEGLYGAIPNRGQRSRITYLRKRRQARTEVDRWNESIATLRQLCHGLLHVGLRQLRLCALLLGQLHHRRQRHLCRRRDRSNSENRSGDDRQPRAARFVCGFESRCRYQCFDSCAGLYSRAIAVAAANACCAPAASPSFCFSCPSRAYAIKAGPSSLFDEPAR